jgi:hypothetical protein
VVFFYPTSLERIIEKNHHFLRTKNFKCYKSTED